MAEDRAWASGPVCMMPRSLVGASFVGRTESRGQNKLLRSKLAIRGRRVMCDLPL